MIADGLEGGGIDQDSESDADSDSDSDSPLNNHGERKREEEMMGKGKKDLNARESHRCGRRKNAIQGSASLAT